MIVTPFSYQVGKGGCKTCEEMFLYYRYVLKRVYVEAKYLEIIPWILSWNKYP